MRHHILKLSASFEPQLKNQTISWKRSIKSHRVSMWRAATMLHLTIIAVLITTAASQTPTTTQYTNHTVGGPAGWFFNSTTNNSVANYSSWAASQTFNLGDYLIFNTNSNQTVIQTYNETSFRICSIEDDLSDNDTFQFYGGNPQFGEAAIIPVPLTIVGPNYFFSDAEDGTQCQQGMAFEINVNRGLGLPPSLNQPPPPPYIEPPGPDSAQPPPVTIAGGSPDPANGASRGGGFGVRAVVGAIVFAVAGVPLC